MPSGVLFFYEVRLSIGVPLEWAYNRKITGKPKGKKKTVCTKYLSLLQSWKVLLSHLNFFYVLNPSFGVHLQHAVVILWTTYKRQIMTEQNKKDDKNCTFLLIRRKQFCHLAFCFLMACLFLSAFFHCASVSQFQVQ